MASDLEANVEQMVDWFVKVAWMISSKWGGIGIESKFSDRVEPCISYSDYVRRLMRHSNCGRQCWHMVLIYMDRLKGVILNQNSLYTLTLSALVLSIKYSEDIYESNRYYAKLGGVTLQLLNELELELFELLSFQLFIEQLEVFQ